MRNATFNGNPETIKTGTLGIPGRPNILFNSSANIVPSVVVNPRAYQNGNLILSPLNLTGGTIDGVFPQQHEPPAGALTTEPGPYGFDALQAPMHYYSINGKQPGR